MDRIEYHSVYRNYEIFIKMEQGKPDQYIAYERGGMDVRARESTLRGIMDALDEVARNKRQHMEQKNDAVSTKADP